MKMCLESRIVHLHDTYITLWGKEIKLIAIFIFKNISELPSKTWCFLEFILPTVEISITKFFLLPTLSTFKKFVPLMSEYSDVPSPEN